VWSAQTGVCMLVHARARTKTRGNPDRGTRPLRHLRTGTPRCSLAGSVIRSWSRHCDGGKDTIASDISCYRARVQQQHDAR